MVLDKINAAAREAVEEIASTMLFVSIHPMSSGTDVEVGISAIVGLNGGLKGCARLGSPNGTAIALASALMGEEIGEFTAEGADAFGELANMITGGIQTRLSGELGEINLTPPVVINGPGHTAHCDSCDQIAVTQFESDGSPFFFEVMYSTREQ